jgi:exosortase
MLASSPKAPAGVAASWRALRASVPAPFLAALALAAGFMVFVGWDQSHWWRTKEDYSFGWLVPIFVAFVVHDRWSGIVTALQACATAGSPRTVGWRSALLWMVLVLVLLFGVMMFLLGAFYRAGAGASNPGTLAITLGMIGVVFALLFVNAPESPAASVAVRWRDDARLRLVSLFVFPVLVWIVSAPMVSVVESQVSLALLRRVVTVVAFVFDVAGVPIEQQGNVLALPNGSVGVEDACSGIRSLTGCLFAGSFLAAVFLQHWWQKVALVIAALLLAFLTNLGRSLFLTMWAYRHGPTAIEGTVHDIAGYAVLGLTVVGLLCLLPLLNLGSGRQSA